MSNSRDLKINLIDVLELLIRRKWLILGITILATVSTIVYSLVVPERYVAGAVLMPPSSSEVSGIKNILKNTPLGKVGGLEKIAGGVPTDLASIYLAILGSQSLQLEVIRKFNLVKVYKFDKAKRYYTEDLLKEFNRHLNFDVNDDGTLYILVEDESPRRAAAMATYMVQQLDETYKRLMTEKNRNHRIFLGQRLEMVRADLAKAEKNLVEFQKRNRMIDIESQAKATVTTGVNLEARYIALKGSLEIARKTYTQDHPRVRELQMQLDQLDKQRRELSGATSSDFLLPYQAGPEIGLEYLQLSREQEIQETIFELMLQQYEEARFEESRNTPNVQILDPATVPQKKVYPKRRKMVMMAFMLSFVAACVLVLSIEFLSRFSAGRPEETARLKRLLKQTLAIRTRR